MISLLDVNILVALFDPAHSHHDMSHVWLQANKTGGWATCPITENGFVRVISNPAYPGNSTTIADAVARLGRFKNSGSHNFWPDMPSLSDDSLFEPRRIKGHQQITDSYLLALAVAKGGRLATVDRRIQLSAVRGATAANLAIVAI